MCLFLRAHHPCLQQFSVHHSIPQVYPMRRKLLETLQKAKDTVRVPGWIHKRGMRDMVIFNPKAGRFRIGGPGGGRKVAAAVTSPTAAGPASPTSPSNALVALSPSGETDTSSVRSPGGPSSLLMY